MASYGDNLHVAITGNTNAVDDIDELVAGMQQSARELSAAAEIRRSRVSTAVA